jgi:hypothetical protein
MRKADVRWLTVSVPRGALRAQPPENEFAITKDTPTKGTRGRPGHVVPLHILDVAASVADEVVMTHAFGIEARSAALDGYFPHQTGKY